MPLLMIGSVRPKLIAVLISNGNRLVPDGATATDWLFGLQRGLSPY